MAANKNSPVQMNTEQIFGVAEKEMEYRVELFNRLTNSCFNKCIDKRFKEGELHIGENSCLDRCVSKYWQGFAVTVGILKDAPAIAVTNLIGHMLGNQRPT